MCTCPHVFGKSFSRIWSRGFHPSKYYTLKRGNSCRAAPPAKLEIPGIQVWQVCEKGLFAHSHFTIYWNLFKLLYFMELTYPTLGKGKSSTQKWFLMGCVSSLESILWKIHGTYKSAHLERKMIWTKPPLLCSFFSSAVYPSAAGGCEAILSLNLPACSYWDCRRLQAEKQAKVSLRVISPPPPF